MSELLESRWQDTKEALLEGYKEIVVQLWA